jgi:hypothetical protein
MTARTGGCLCGGVRFTAERIETHHHACHCGMCRRWAGGPLFVTAAEGVSFEGADNLGRFDSSDWAQRGFCTRCGSNLFYLLKPAGQYFMCVGALDGAQDFRLDREIYIDHKPPGYAFAGDLERQTEAEVLAAFSGSP